MGAVDKIIPLERRVVKSFKIWSHSSLNNRERNLKRELIKVGVGRWRRRFRPIDRIKDNWIVFVRPVERKRR